MANKFQLKAPYRPAGDQPQAIKKLVEGVEQGLDKQTLLGVTGSGKTASMAWVIEKLQKPALVMSHNKTLTAQLTDEFREFFPENAVEYFVSYYDYYQPEAYVPRTDTYIAKDSSINEEIDRLRHAAMESLLERRDVIVVASVSCIYGIGSPQDYLESRLVLEPNQLLSRKELLLHLTRLQYTRNDTDLLRGTFRVRGDVVDIHPSGEEHIVRVEFFGPQIDRVVHLNGLTGEVLRQPDRAAIFPATFYITSPENMKAAARNIRQEMVERVEHFKFRGKLLEAQRIQERTTYDLEMIEQLGFVSGIENYSRHIDGRAPGQPSSTLLDYFRFRYGDDFLVFIDESHMTIPQIGGMYAGDKARKEVLIEHGFRLPSALDNRPLKFHEFEDKIAQTIFVSATPAQYEHNTSKQTVEQIVRPTGLVDPTIAVKPTEHQIDDVIDEIQQRIAKKQRILVTTLTKRMAEELATYLIEMGIKATYLHADIDTLERLEILRDLRTGMYDVLVGINLLREGLDLPEVSLVAIMGADKEGYLRSSTSLVQIMGRAARHLEGHVIMYADRLTGSMKDAMTETERRRAIQEQYNQEHGITPRSILKNIRDSRLSGKRLEVAEMPKVSEVPADELRRIVKELESKMELASRNLEFERAAELRDMIGQIRQQQRKK